MVSGVQEITLEGESGKWSFYVGEGYLYAAGDATKSQNYLKTQSTIDANAQATISFTSGDVTIKFSSATSRNTIKYNSSSSLFSCYASGQQSVQIYKKEIQDGKTKTTLSFGTDYDGKTITKNVGDIFEVPAILSPAVEGATITYKSSDETVAEVVDGTVETKKEGTATITASYAGNDTYRASSASYTIKAEKIATTLSFPNASYTFTEGNQDGAAEITDNYAVLSPSEAGTVSYSVTSTEGLVEMDNGYVLVNTKVVGSATITASFAGNDKYKASEASYTIEVKKAAEDGVFDFSSPDLYGYDVPASSKNVEVGSNGTIIAGNVVITNVKDGNTNTRFYNNKGTIGLRVYKDAKLIISVPENYVVTDITIDANKTDVYTIGALNKKSVEIDFSNYTQIQSMIVRYTKLASLTTAASGFSTYAADYAVNYSEAGLKAYAVKVSDDKTKVAYTECTGVVPAGKAVLVKGEPKTPYTLTPATDEAATFDTDLLVSDGTKVGDGKNIFAFGTKNEVSGFKLVKNGTAIPAKKGYLVVEASAAGAKDFFAFDDSTNGIDDPTIEIPDDDVPLFNLAGQRVGKDYKGIVVKNGKKYVNK